MRCIVFLLIVLLLGAGGLARAANSTEDSNYSQEASQIMLNATELLRLPHLSIINPEANFTYTFPHSHFPVYAENQSMTGLFKAPEGLAGSAIKLCLSGFSVTGFLESLAPEGLSNPQCQGTMIELNATGQSPINLQGTKRGLYTLSAIEENNTINTTMLSTSFLPLLVVSRNLTLDMPDNLSAGEPLLLRINDSSGFNQSRIFAAVLVSRSDYENASLSLETNGTSKGLNSTIAIGNKTLEVPGLPSLSMDLMMKLMYLLPEDSGVGMQESKAPGVEIYIITDEQWLKGEYILSCAVYAPGEGLVGVKQHSIEVTEPTAPA